MRFRCKDGATEQFGYTFPAGEFVDVKDERIAGKLRGNPSFEIEGEEVIQEPEEGASTVCDRCGKTFKRGLTMHRRFCKG